MNVGIRKTMTLALEGFLYGLALAFFGVMAAGAGHGTYVLLGLYASPLSLVPNVPLAVFGIPLLWCIIGVLLAGTPKRVWTVAFLVAMLAHYVSLPLVLKDGNTFGDWEYVAKVWDNSWFFVLLCIGLYVLAQLVIWYVFLTGRILSLTQWRMQ